MSGFGLRVSASVQHLDSRVSNQDLGSSPTQFLKSNMAAAWTILEWRRQGSIMTLHRFRMLGEIEVLNFFSIENHHYAGSLAGDLIMIPFRGFVNLPGGCHGPINSSGQF